VRLRASAESRISRSRTPSGSTHCAPAWELAHDANGICSAQVCALARLFLALRSLSRFTEWARKYGGIYSVSANSYGYLEGIIYSSLQLKVGSGTAVVLTDPAAVKELMDKRSGSTVERPPSHIVDLVTGGLNMVCANFSTRPRHSSPYPRCRPLPTTVRPSLCKLH
jgi:hypothetical protein